MTPHACNVLGFKTRAGICLTSICVVILSIKAYVALDTLWPSINRLTELEKCPACYGISECNEIQTIDFEPSDALSWISYFFGVKNVFFGTLEGTKVALKKLGHTSELAALDRAFNDLKRNERSIDFYDLVEKELSLNFSDDDKSRLRLCPTTERINNLFGNIYHKTETVHSEYSELYLWTLVKINPEPLVLQILPAEDGWPVPKYLGACGRIIAEEYVGLPLSAYYHEPWMIRAKVALSLLDAARAFTFRNENFGFYLTDVSADNVAVGSDGTAKFIDLENVIVVDKNGLADDSGERFALQENAADFDCTDCFVFSAADICSRRISDHNYFSVCKILLSTDAADVTLPGGLLHDVPPDIAEGQPTLQDLIRQCAEAVPRQARITAGDRLGELLRKIL